MQQPAWMWQAYSSANWERGPETQRHREKTKKTKTIHTRCSLEKWLGRPDQNSLKNFRKQGVGSQDAPAMKVINYFKHLSNDQHIFKNLLYVDGQKPHVYFEYFGSVKIMVDWGKNNLQSKGPSLLKLAYFMMNLNPISPQQQRQQKRSRHLHYVHWRALSRAH